MEKHQLIFYNIDKSDEKIPCRDKRTHYTDKCDVKIKKTLRTLCYKY